MINEKNYFDYEKNEEEVDSCWMKMIFDIIYKNDQMMIDKDDQSKRIKFIKLKLKVF